MDERFSAMEADVVGRVRLRLLLLRMLSMPWGFTGLVVVVPAEQGDGRGGGEGDAERPIAAFMSVIECKAARGPGPGLGDPPELLLASTMPGLVTCAQSVWARCNLA